MTGEALCRAVILGRTGAVCEGCRSRVWTDKAHRVARSHGGQWRPGNVIGLCPACHRWAHAHPTHAEAAGWILPSGSIPEAHPVFLASASLEPGWYFLTTDGEPYGYGHPALPAEPPAELPPYFPRELLPPARIDVA